MTEAKAKEVLRRSGPPENVAEHIEALQVALQVLGDDATMAEIWKWAEGGCSASEKVVKYGECFITPTLDTLSALVPILQMNREKVVSIEAVEDWYTIDGREYMKEVAEIEYESGYCQYADIGCDSNLTAICDVIAVINQVKPKSSRVERIVRDVYPKPEPTKGKWIVKANGGNIGERSSHTCICPKCGATYYCYDKGQYQIEMSNFCPNCGEKMNPDATDTNVEDWTSVSEGLPDFSVEVLTYTESADLIEIQTLEVNVEGEYHWENQHGDCQDEQAVTKWRPLPKRPRPHAK